MLRAEFLRLASLRVIGGALALAIAASSIAWAQDDDASGPTPKPITGDYYLAPGGDAPEGAPADNYYITLTGDSAKAMWDAMQQNTQPDECVGRMAKYGEGFVCYGPATPGGTLAPDDSAFECSFGIDLKKGGLSTGQDC
jgi:hypothetical protein